MSLYCRPFEGCRVSPRSSYVHEASELRFMSTVNAGRSALFHTMLQSLLTACGGDRRAQHCALARRRICGRRPEPGAPHGSARSDCHRCTQLGGHTSSDRQISSESAARRRSALDRLSSQPARHGSQTVGVGARTRASFTQTHINSIASGAADSSTDSSASPTQPCGARTYSTTTTGRHASTAAGGSWHPP